MGQPPDFPQEKNPAILYIVTQVSKIEDAQACGTGYYNSLAKVNKRLDTTDIILNQLKDVTGNLNKVVSSDGVLHAIDRRTNFEIEVLKRAGDEITATTRIELQAIGKGTIDAVAESLARMEHNSDTSIATINATNDRTRRIQDDMAKQIGATINRVDTYIKQVNDR